MSDILGGFVRKKEFLICIDSDGCAINTMDSKHKSCFGPCLVKQWGLEPWEKHVLNRWNAINLYTQTRGINRYKSLALILKEVNQNYKEVEALDVLENWVQTAAELSNASIEAKWKECGTPILKQALDWSRQVNEKIDGMPVEEKRAFDGVKQVLEEAHKVADIVIVSSANRQAVLEEWEKQGLLQYTDLMLAQDAGTKAHCIRMLLDTGYEPDHVLMIGDAPGDYMAATENHILFFPILVNRESESWHIFLTEALNRLVQEEYTEQYQKQKLDEFKENLESE